MDKEIAASLDKLDSMSLAAVARTVGYPAEDRLCEEARFALVERLANDRAKAAELRTLLLLSEKPASTADKPKKPVPAEMPMPETRLPIDKYFMDIAFKVAERGTCLRRRVGAIAVKDKRILATGYNGAPSGLSHCAETGCVREKLAVPSGERHELCRAVHAEQNVIVQAARHGISLEGASLYCTTFPCSICTKMLINCGIREIFYVAGYRDALSEQLLQEAGIPYTVLL